MRFNFETKLEFANKAIFHKSKSDTRFLAIWIDSDRLFGCHKFSQKSIRPINLIRLFIVDRMEYVRGSFRRFLYGDFKCWIYIREQRMNMRNNRFTSIITYFINNEQKTWRSKVRFIKLYSAKALFLSLNTYERFNVYSYLDGFSAFLPNIISRTLIIRFNSTQISQKSHI